MKKEAKRKVPLLTRVYHLLGKRLPTKQELLNSIPQEDIDNFLRLHMRRTNIRYVTNKQLNEERQRILKHDYSWMEDKKPSFMSKIKAKIANLFGKKSSQIQKAPETPKQVSAPKPMKNARAIMQNLSMNVPVFDASNTPANARFITRKKTAINQKLHSRTREYKRA